MRSSRPGRSDYPNQVNNVLCFPFLFRGALDVGATTINEEMKLAAVRAIAELAQAEVSDVVATAYGDQRPVRPGLPDPDAVRSAPDQRHCAGGCQGRDGQRRRDAPLADLKPIAQRMARFMYQSGAQHGAGVRRGKVSAKRIVYAEGEDDRVLRAAQVIVDERLAKPILIGRPEIIEAHKSDLGLRAQGRDRIVRSSRLDDAADENQAAEEYYRLVRRSGVTQAHAEGSRCATARRSSLRCCSISGERTGHAVRAPGTYHEHLSYVRKVIGLREGVTTLGSDELCSSAADGCSCATPSQSRPDSRATRRLLCSRPKRSPLRLDAARRLAFPFEFRQRRHASARKMRGRPVARP